jgi:hypothetical protein
MKLQIAGVMLGVALVATACGGSSLSVSDQVAVLDQYWSVATAPSASGSSTDEMRASVCGSDPAVFPTLKISPFPVVMSIVPWGKKDPTKISDASWLTGWVANKCASTWALEAQHLAETQKETDAAIAAGSDSSGSSPTSAPDVHVPNPDLPGHAPHGPSLGHISGPHW